MTVGEWLRLMSDEELAAYLLDFLMDVPACSVCEYGGDSDSSYCEEHCNETHIAAMHLRWLQSEV